MWKEEAVAYFNIVIYLEALSNHENSRSGLSISWQILSLDFPHSKQKQLLQHRDLRCGVGVNRIAAEF
jgi:hypothetical protein